MPHGLGHLVIKFCNENPRARSDTKLLVSSLEQVLCAEDDWAVTYDFRLAQPTPSVAKVFEQNRERLARHAKTVALLISDNIYEAGAKTISGRIIRSFLPGCPAIVCHCEHIAKEFFSESSAISNEFVSVVAIKEGKDDSQAAGPSGPLSHAVIKPTVRKSGSEVDATMHILPNGDVRVIQTPASDVVKCKEIYGKQHKAVGLQLKSTGRSSTLAAITFKCRKEHLEPLIGTHFHVGELIADAEAESTGRQQSVLKVHCKAEASPQPLETRSCFTSALHAILWMCRSS